MTVAILVEPEIHGLEPAGVPDPVKEVVDPEQTEVLPDMVGRECTTKFEALVVVLPEAVTDMEPVVALAGTTAVILVELTTI